MSNENQEQAILEAQLQWVKKREALLAQIEGKLYDMKHIAEQVASDEIFIFENQKERLNE